MSTSYRHCFGLVHGRERRRLSARFPLLSVEIDQPVFDHLHAWCETREEAEALLRRLLFRNSCCVWGPVSATDRKINEHVMKDVWRGQGRHCVVSRHRVGLRFVEVVSDLRDNSTRVRLEPRQPRLPESRP